jgi:hypothetical protein
MSEAVKDMIQQALDQDYNDANKTFNDVMTIKMSDLLDQEKVRLADQIYNGVEPNDEDDDDIVGDEDGDDQLELDLETEGESESEGETEEEDEEEDFEYDEDDVEEVDSEKSE